MDAEESEMRRNRKLIDAQRALVTLGEHYLGAVELPRAIIAIIDKAREDQGGRGISDD
jgi:hypothetical protein